jgi:hypothetical protein
MKGLVIGLIILIIKIKLGELIFIDSINKMRLLRLLSDHDIINININNKVEFDYYMSINKLECDYNIVV